jgi:protein-glutamine gamma-glutamyltransferase
MEMSTTRSAARRDFTQLNGMAQEIYGRETRIVDNARIGEVGALDAKDQLATVRAGNPVTRVLGARRAEDLAFRQAVVNAACALAAGGADFSASDKTDKVNSHYWGLGYGGKMSARKFMADGTLGKPSEALNDIFMNGKQYAFECATAMMVIYHKAILDHVGAKAFDAMFSDPGMLNFFRWERKDQDFVDVERLVHKPVPLHPGSHYYYENPDASPENSAFRGENVIYLGNGRFYAHGVIGKSGTYVVTEKELLKSLSSLRRRGSKIAPKRVAMEMHLDGLAISKKACAQPVPARGARA